MQTTIKELKELANYYGFDLVDVSSKPPYNERKSKTWGFYDRRSGLTVATFSDKNRSRIKEYLSQFKG